MIEKDKPLVEKNKHCNKLKISKKIINKYLNSSKLTHKKVNLKRDLNLNKNYFSIQKYKQKNITNYFNKPAKIYTKSQKAHTKNIFNNTQIKKIIKVFNKLSQIEEYDKLNYYINKFNKYQTIQILIVFKLIKKNSNAPVNLLKNILLNYFCSNIKLSLF